jgi:hypothetical protein
MGGKLWGKRSELEDESNTALYNSMSVVTGYEVVKMTLMS